MRTAGVIPLEKLPEEIQGAVAELASVGLESTMNDAKVLLHRGIRAGFNSSVDPNTQQQWAPRKRSYPHPILIKTGAMMQAATGGGAGAIQQVGQRQLVIGVDGAIIAYAAFHQVGTQKMDARPFVGASEETLAQIDNLIADAALAIF